MDEAKLDRVIIIGSGMAGLASAAALAPHFEEVVLVERDRIHKVGRYHQSPFLRPSSRPAKGSGCPRPPLVCVLFSHNGLCFHFSQVSSKWSLITVTPACLPTSGSHVSPLHFTLISGCRMSPLQFVPIPGPHVSPLQFVPIPGPTCHRETPTSLSSS